MRRRKAWYEALEAARRVESKGDAVASASLAAEASIAPSVASSWLGKFARWGYVVRIGRQESAGRPHTIYELTRWGREFRPGAKGTKIPERLRAVANPKKED